MSDFSFVLRLIAETFLAIGRNWTVVLRITLIPLLLPISLLVGWFTWAMKSAYLVHYLPKQVGGGDEVPVFALALILIAAVGTLPVAVAWHRFDHMGEAPRALWPRLYPGASFGYFGRSLLLVLIAIVFGICLMLPMYAFIQKSSTGSFSFSYGALPEPRTAWNFVLSAIYFAALIGLLTRWSLILPARALGQSLTLKDSREAASARLSLKGYFLLGLLLHLFSILLDLLLAELATGYIGLLLVLPCVLLFQFMFNIALLTRLYGHCVKAPAL